MRHAVLIVEVSESQEIELYRRVYEEGVTLDDLVRRVSAPRRVRKPITETIRRRTKSHDDKPE